MHRQVTRREALALAGAAAATPVAPLLGWTRGGRAATSGTTNVLWIITDDQPRWMLRYMPKTQRLLGALGMDFMRGYAAVPWCGPARASMLTGLYVHNHGCETNMTHPAFHEKNLEEQTVAVRLKKVGYTTGLFGKYLNGYGQTPRYIPPGWDRWVASVSASSGGDILNAYEVNVEGELRIVDRSECEETRYYSDRLERFMRGRAERSQPWYALFAPTAPHKPYTPSPQNAHTFDGVEPRRVESINEADMTDKPDWLQGLPKIEYDKRQKIVEGKLEELQDVDDAIARICRTLSETGQRANTVVFFTSDNGYLVGEHRLLHKDQPYEESVKLPFLVRGAGVRADVKNAAFASQVDLPATTCELARADASGMDGRSLVGALAGGHSGRKRLLSENPAMGWRMLREGPYSYIEHDSGDRELYDLKEDRYELRSLHDKRPKVVADLSVKLETLSQASGEELRMAETN